MDIFRHEQNRGRRGPAPHTGGKVGTSDRTQPKYLNNRIRLQQNRKRGVQAPQPGEDEPPEQTQPMYKHEFFREQQNRG